MTGLLTCSRATCSTSSSRIIQLLLPVIHVPCDRQVQLIALQKDPEVKDELVDSRSAGLGSELSLPNRSAEMRPMESLFTVSSKQSGEPQLSSARPILLQAKMQLEQGMQARSLHS